MIKTTYSAEFKADALRQVLELGMPVRDVAKRLGISDQTLYVWVGFAKRRQNGGAEEVAKLTADGVRLRNKIRLIKEELFALRLATETISKMYK